MLVTAVVLGACSFVSAQQPKFVLFENSAGDSFDAPAEHQAVHPLTAPYFHEDAFVTSDLRAWYLYHEFPETSLIDGGKAQVYALQLRLALTEELQLVAYKDGFADFDTGLVDDTGWMDVGAGLKWAFYQDFEEQTHLAVGAGYEFAWGDKEVLQDDDEFRLWISGNKGIDQLHLGATVNWFLAPDANADLGNSDHLSWHLHADYWVNEHFSPVIEVNGYHVLDEGMEVLPFQGVDVANFGGGKGEDVITVGIGGEFRPTDE